MSFKTQKKFLKEEKNLTSSSARKSMLLLLVNSGFAPNGLSQLSNDELFDEFAPRVSQYMKRKDIRDYKTALGIRHLYKSGGSYERAQ